MEGIGILLAIPLFGLFALVIKKAGYSGWWVLFGLIPGVGLIALWVFAFSHWPVDEGDEGYDGTAYLRNPPQGGP
jgi:hypothetical protein